MAYRSTTTHAFTAAQFVRQFAECRSLARDEPVFISSYGRTTHALLGIAHFDTLAKNTSGRVDGEGEAALLNEWGMRAGLAVIVCDAQMVVEAINTAGCSLVGVRQDDAVGQSLERALAGPQLLTDRGEERLGGGEDGAKNLASITNSHGQREPSLLLTLARRCWHSREDVSADVPSPFGVNAWLKISCFVWLDHLVITLKDITSEVRLERLADREASLAEAMDLHSGVAAVRLSLRGVVESAGNGLAQLVGLPHGRLIGAQFIDMVDIHSRVATRAAIEAVLRGDGGQQIDLRLIKNTGGIAQVTASLVQLRGAYGVEGLTMVLKEKDVSIPGEFAGFDQGRPSFATLG